MTMRLSDFQFPYSKQKKGEENNIGTQGFTRHHHNDVCMIRINLMSRKLPLRPNIVIITIETCINDYEH